MRVVILEPAMDDLRAGRRFYARQGGRDLGRRFFGSLSETIGSLSDHGGIHVRKFGFYRALAAKFPYSVYYDIEGDAVRVHAVVDKRRNLAWVEDRVVGAKTRAETQRGRGAEGEETWFVREGEAPEYGEAAKDAKSAKGGRGMKIVKWTRGLDSPGTGKQKQRYPAFGDVFSEMPEEEYSRLWAEAEKVVVDCIRRNGFKFDGNYHQYGEFGMPLFDNGTVFFVSWRHWGHLMYRAWNPDGNDPMGYCKYAFGWDIPEEEYKYPQSETDFLQPEENNGNEGAA